jgi:hypothetical protein
VPEDLTDLAVEEVMGRETAPIPLGLDVDVRGACRGLERAIHDRTHRCHQQVQQQSDQGGRLAESWAKGSQRLESIDIG